MGHKTNATGFRLQTKKNWKSRWFAKGEDYIKFVHEDRIIRDFLQKELVSAGLLRVEIERTTSNTTVNLYVTRPGVVIGKGGSRIEELKDMIKKQLSETKLKINVQQVRRSDVSALLIATDIAQQIEKKIYYKRVIKRTISQVMDSGKVEGLHITISGRLGGFQIARTDKNSAGNVPMQTIDADIDYATATAQTKYGLIGIKVWLHKKEEKNKQI